MKRQILAVAVVAMLLIPGLALAQVCNFDLRYDCSTVTTITGKVITTVSYNPNNPMTGPQAFVLQSDSQTYTVFLGPGWYVSQLGLAPTPGTMITVTGAARTICNTQYLVAQNVAWNNQIFVIRNANGVPLWSIISVPAQQTVPAPVGSGPSGITVPFDQNSMVNLQGQIMSLSTIQTTDSCEPLLVATITPTSGTCPAGTVQVVLAPQSFFASNYWNLCQGQCISICGSSVTYNCQNYIVATSVSTSCKSLTLRASCGTPQWSAGAPLGAGPAAPNACGSCGAQINVPGPCPSCGTPCNVNPPVGTGPCNPCGPGYMVVPPPPADSCD